MSFNYTLGKRFSGGTYCAVYEAFRVPDGEGFVIKKNRASESAKIRRSILRHEARMMQVLQGHPSLPLGYGRANHFEVIAMDRLGGTVENKVISDGKSLLPLTVARIGDQMLSALRHLHSHNIVHHDIKPDNMLLSLEDPSRVILIDFNISVRVLPGQNGEPQKALSETLHGVVGSVKWCSLNAHRRLPLQTQDDVESLAYLLLFLLRAELPWMKGFGNEHPLQRIARVGAKKQAYSGADLSAGFPSEFGQILDQARTSWDEGDPTSRILQTMHEMMYRLTRLLGLSNVAAPLDWSPGTRTYSRPIATEYAEPYSPPGDDEDDDDDDEVEEYSNSYWLPDFMDWMHVNAVATGRSKELTFPSFEAELLDEQIPTIPVVHPYSLESDTLYADTPS